MSISVVQSLNGTTISGATVAGTFGSNTTSGNNLIVVNYGDKGASPITVSSIAIDHGSASFSKVIARAGTASVGACEIWQASNITGGTTPKITVTWSGTTTGGEFEAYEVSGLDSGGATDGTTTSNQTNVTALSDGPISTNNANDLLVAGFTCGGSATAGESGWTAVVTSGTNLSEYDIVSATGSYTATGTQSPSSNALGAFATFKAASGGSTVNLGSVTMQAALGIRNSPVIVGKMPSVTMQALLGIRNNPVVVGKMPSVTMQALLGIRNSPALASKMPSVTMQALLGITSATIGKLLISAQTMSAALGIKPAPALSAGQQPNTYFVLTDGAGVHRVVLINPQTGD